jgi:hypothetical protein
VTDFLSIPSVGGGDLVVWAPDWSTYADSAAFNAAWTESDPSNLVTWDLNGTHKETSTSPVPHVNMGGVTVPSGTYVATMSFTVTGLVPGKTYRYRYDIYSTGQTSLTPNTWVAYKDVAVVADGSGNVAVPIEEKTVSTFGGTFTAYEAWYDRIRLIDPNPPTLPIRCAIDQCSMTRQRTEDRQRALDGTMMVLVGPTIRTWDVTTIPLAATDFNALLAALQASPIVPLTGDWLGGSTVNVWPKLGSATPVAATAVPQSLTFTAIEAI